MKKRVLGQGLSSLLGPEVAVSENHEGYKEIYTSQLIPGEGQPRVEQLASSIRSNGVLQPLIVRKKEENLYEIVAGERRWRAAKKAGLDRVPVIVRELHDDEAQTIALIENIQRENLTPIEEARGYARIMKKMRTTQEDTARLVGKSRVYVANICRLLSLPTSIQEMVDNGSLSAGHARLLVGMEDAVSAAEHMLQKKLSVRRAELYVRRLKGGPSPSSEETKTIKARGSDDEQTLVPAAGMVNSHLTAAEKEELEQIEGFLSSRMGCSVRVLSGAEPDKKIQIVFSLDDRAKLDDFLSSISAISS